MVLPLMALGSVMVCAAVLVVAADRVEHAALTVSRVRPPRWRADVTALGVATDSLRDAAAGQSDR